MSVRGLALLTVFSLAVGCADERPSTPVADAGEVEDSGTDDGGAALDDAAVEDGSDGAAPEARVSADPTSGEAPLVVRFDGSGSSDADGDITGHRWDFGDGNTAEGATVEHTFASVGSFTVALTVEDSRGHTARAEVTVEVALPACPTFNTPQAAGRVTAPYLAEVSGLAASRRDDTLLWVNNDSGDGPIIYAIDTRGAVRAGYELVGAQAVDWEDITVGPGPVEGTSYIYVGDIGDNDLQSDIAPVYRIPEPTNVPVAPAEPSLFRIRTVETIVLSYGGGRAFNSETMMADPENGDLYVVTKTTTGRSLVFRAAAPLAGGSRIQMEEVGTVNVRGEATGGDISVNGDIIIRTYEGAYLWRRPPGVSVADALRETPCTVRLNAEPQGEAISFSADGQNLWTTSEGTGQWLYRYTRR